MLTNGVKALSHRAGHDKAKQNADEQCFHTEREMTDCLQLIHERVIVGADRECILLLAQPTIQLNGLCL